MMVHRGIFFRTLTVRQGENWQRTTRSSTPMTSGAVVRRRASCLYVCIQVALCCLLGVVALEVLLATEAVFSVNDATKKRVDIELLRRVFYSSAVLDTVYLCVLGSVGSSLGLFPPPIVSSGLITRNSPTVSENSLISLLRSLNMEFIPTVSSTCLSWSSHSCYHSDMEKEKLNASVTKADAFNRGLYDNPWYASSAFIASLCYLPTRLGEYELDIVFRMLQWRPEDRATAEELLEHPYFSFSAETVSEQLES